MQFRIRVTLPVGASEIGMEGPNDLTSSLVAQKEIMYNRYPGKAVLAFLSKKIIPVPWSKKGQGNYIQSCIESFC